MLLNLPPEVRLRIYCLLCTSPHPVSLTMITTPCAFPHSLLLTNTQLYHEIRPLFFKLNTFHLSLLNLPIYCCPYNYFLHSSFRDNRLQIPSLIVTLWRWGTKDFFTETLVPIIEDCILNGRLRRLECRIGEDWFGKEMKAEGKGRRNRIESNLRALKRLLKDPYLQRGILLTVEGRFKDDCEYSSDGPTKFKDVTKRLDELEDNWFA